MRRAQAFGGSSPSASVCSDRFAPALSQSRGFFASAERRVEAPELRLASVRAHGPLQMGLTRSQRSQRGWLAPGPLTPSQRTVILRERTRGMMNLTIARARPKDLLSERR